jgi:hypothetical protein
MSNTSARSGSCLCGAVTITADTASKEAGACHCDMCRKWGGGPLLAVDCGTAVSIEGEDSVTVFESSEWAERAFCKHCGSHLFYRFKESQQHIIPAGFLSNEDTLVFDHQIFIDQKPSYYEFSNKTVEMTAEEVFAKYTPSTD